MKLCWLEPRSASRSALAGAEAPKVDGSDLASETYDCPDGEPISAAVRELLCDTRSFSGPPPIYLGRDDAMVVNK